MILVAIVDENKVDIAATRRKDLFQAEFEGMSISRMIPSPQTNTYFSRNSGLFSSISSYLRSVL